MSVTLLKNVLLRYMSDVFIELDPPRAKIARIALAGMPGVELFEGDSVDVLPRILSTLDEKATIFLDAHPIGAADMCTFGKKRWPLTEELRLIAALSKRKDHSIMIDDLHETKLFETSKEELTSLLRAINPVYKIQEEPTVFGPGHMLCASV